MTGEQFVIFLDILGFKDRVFRNAHQDLERELLALNGEIIQIVNESWTNKQEFVAKGDEGRSSTGIVDKDDSPIKLAQFSDSIVLFSHDVSPDSLKQISTAASRIMNTALSKKFPMKGALAQGMLTYDYKKQLFFGRALIDAYLLEEEVHYYGIAVHHSAEYSVANSELDLFADNNIFLKSGRIKHYELCWYRDKETGVKKTEYNLNEIRQTVSGQPRKYIDNTLVLINSNNK